MSSQGTVLGKRVHRREERGCFHFEGNVSEAYRRQGRASMLVQILTEENHLLIYVLVSAMAQDQTDIHEIVNS